MSGLSIPRPSTQVEQEFVSETPSFATPAQQSCLVGPCFQIVSAFDDNQLPQDEAYAGPYRDGLGVISYDFPSLIEGALVAEYLTDVRVFLVFGSERQELNSPYDEALVVAGTNGELDGTTTANTVFTRPGLDFVTEGVAEGDALRFTYRGSSVDILISGVTSTELALDDSSTESVLYQELLASPSIDLTLATFQIIRNPAQWVYSVEAANASASLGPAAGYGTIRIAGTASDSLLGSGGDGVTVSIEPQPAFLQDSTCFVGMGVFWATGQAEDFTASIGAAGPVAAGTFMIQSAIGTGNAFVDVLRVISEEILIIDDTAENQSGIDYKIVSQTSTNTDGATDGGDETMFSSAGASFLTSIPQVGGAGTAPATDTYLEIEGVGVFRVTTVTDNNNIIISAGASGGLTDQTYTIAEVVLEESGVGNTGAENGAATTVCFAGGGLTSGLLTGRAIIVEQDDGEWEGEAFSSSPAEAYLDDYLADVGGTLTGSSSALTAEIVDVSTNMALLWDADARTLVIQPARGSDGLSTGGFADPGDNDGLYLDGALEDEEDPAYNATVAAIFAYTDSGLSFAFEETAARMGIVLTLDGGTDVGDILVGENLIGSTTPTGRIYVSYKALRTDVTPAAETPLFYEINDISQITTLLGDLPGNPLAIAAWFNLASAPRSPVRVLGVSDANAANPNGTSAAYAEAFAFLEPKKVYVIVPLTQDPVVGQFLQAHVDTMSLPENAGERLGIINSAMPTHAPAAVIASGTSGNTGTVAGQATAEFATSVDFALAEAQAGDILVVSARASAAEHLDSVNGTVGPLYGATITGVKAGDRFVLEFDGTGFPSPPSPPTPDTVSWNGLIDVTWTLYRPGASISIPADQAEAIAAIGEGYADRRIIHVWPDTVEGPVDGTTMLLEGFYAAAGVAGLISGKKPADPLTNANVAGLTGLKNSSGYFTKAHLDRMAGGGTCILVQDAPNQPVKVRHQLSTDTSSVERREISVTTALDYISAVYRATLDPQIGIVNITDELLTDIGTKADGLNQGFIDQGIVRNATLLSVEEDPLQPDRIIIEVGIRSLLPNNYNTVRLLVGGA